MKTRDTWLIPAFAVLALVLAGPGPASPQDAQDPYIRVQQAQAALDAGDHEKVLEIVDGLLAEYPDSPSSHLLRGMALDELGRYDEAEESYGAALRNAPDEPQILTRYGMHYIRREEWGDAIPPLQKSVEAVPDDPVTLFYLAQAYFHADQRASSVETMERAVAAAPDNPTILLKLGEYRAHAGKHSPALEALLRAQELNPAEPGIDLALGNVYLRLLEVEKAREALTRAEQQDPENPAVLASLAEACAKARDHAEALKYYRKILALGHDDAAYHLGLGAALVGLGENEAAIRALNEAVERSPRLEQAHFHLARAYQAAGQTEESRRELGIFRALKASPFSPLEDRTEFERKLWQQAQALVKEGKEKEALELLAGGNTPGIVPEFLVGVLYYWQDQFDDAERLLEVAESKNPDLPSLRTYQGMTSMQLGRLAEAESALSKELEEHPREPLVLMAMGQLAFVREDWAGAVQYLDGSKIVDTRVLLLLCEAQLRLDERDAARETAQLVMTLGQADTAVQAAARRLLAEHGLEVDEPAAEAVPPPGGAGGHAP